MATQTNHEDFQVGPAGAPNWPELVTKTVGDLSQIARTEIELLEVTLQRLLEAQSDKLMGLGVLLIACAYGSLFLFAGILLVIHLWLALWLSFLITGFAIVGVGVAVQLRMASAAARARELAGRALR